jgi:hypothetical protein
LHGFNHCPPTAVIELAGALGTPSFLLSNVGEMGWRKKDELTKCDVWSANITHVEGETWGDKVSLVEHLIQAVELFIHEKTTKTNESTVIN